MYKTQWSNQTFWKLFELLVLGCVPFSLFLGINQCINVGTIAEILFLAIWAGHCSYFPSSLSTHTNRNLLKGGKNVNNDRQIWQLTDFVILICSIKNINRGKNSPKRTTKIFTNSSCAVVTWKGRLRYSSDFEYGRNLCANSSHFSNSPSADVCVTQGASCSSGNYRDSRPDRISETFCAHALFMLRPCQLLHGQSSSSCSVKFVPYIYSTLVCRYAPIFVFSKATCNRIAQERLIKETQPMEKISITFKGPLPTINKNKYILTIVSRRVLQISFCYSMC